MTIKLRLAMLTLVLPSALIIAACGSSAGPAAVPTAPPQADSPTSVSQPTVALPPTDAPRIAAPTIAPSPTVMPLPTSVPTVAPTPTTAPNPLAGEPKSMLRNAFAKLNSAGPYRIKETTAFTFAGQTQTIDTVREHVPPQRTHAFFKPGLGGVTELINIDNVWYYKNPSGKWTKSDQPPGPSSKTPNVADIIAKAISDVQLVGPEIVNETPTMVYSLKLNLHTETSYTGTAKVWLGVTDGLPRQMDIQS